jgi:hypothetical protein
MAGKEAESLAQEAATRVREIVASATRRAEEIVSQAEAEAERIRTEAEAQARKRLDQVRQALEQLEEGLGATRAPEVREPEQNPEALNPEPKAKEPEAKPPDSRPPDPAPRGKASTKELIERLKAGGETPKPEPERTPNPSQQEPSNDAGAARLVAMKLALEGTSRNEAHKQLAAQYDIADLDALLDEVYAKAGK